MAKLKPKQNALSPETLNSLISQAITAIDDWCEAGEGRTEWPPEMIEVICLRSMQLSATLYELIDYVERQNPRMVTELRRDRIAQDDARSA